MDLQKRNLFRVLDANANRAMEGMRTIEEIARMILDDAGLSLRLKELRHDLQKILDRFDARMLLEARDTAGDVGTQNQTESEGTRTDLHSVAKAAAGRTQQSLRCLEEFSKLIDAESGRLFEKIRYRAYDLMAESLLKIDDRVPRSSSSSKKPFPKEARLYLLIDCELDLESFCKRLETLCLHGVDVVQIRDKKGDDRKLLDYTRAAKDITSRTGRLLIVNDRVDIALLVGADGLHLGQEDLPIADARRLTGDSMWIGVSTHHLAQALEAVAAGADYIGCGPTFPSKTKTFDAFSGIDFLRQIGEQISIPAFAIGGIELANVARVIEAGVYRVAVQGGLLNASDPVETSLNFSRLLAAGDPTMPKGDSQLESA